MGDEEFLSDAIELLKKMYFEMMPDLDGLNAREIHILKMHHVSSVLGYAANTIDETLKEVCE